MLASAATAQVTPAHPKNFRTRSLGPVSPNPGTTVAPRLPAAAAAGSKHVTYVLLSEERPWTSTAGRTIRGRLVAFEEVLTFTEKGEPPPAAPELPAPADATVVRDGKVRLMVGRRVSVVPLEQLSEADRGFVEQLRAGLEKEEP